MKVKIEKSETRVGKEECSCIFPIDRKERTHLLGKDTRPIKAFIDRDRLFLLIRTDSYNWLGFWKYLRKPNLVISHADVKEMKLTEVIWLLIEVGLKGNQKVYIVTDLCNQLMLGEDWLLDHKAQLKFDPTTPIMERIEVPLGDNSCEALPVMAEWNIKSLPRTVVSCRGRIATEKKLKGELY